MLSVQNQVVSVGILEAREPANPGVGGLEEEADSGRLQVRHRRVEVLRLQRRRPAADSGLGTVHHRRKRQDRSRAAGRFELLPLVLPRVAGLQAEDAGVEGPAASHVADRIDEERKAGETRGCHGSCG